MQAPPSAETNLGRLESVDLRTIWPNEASDFTPWLARAENLAILSQTLGMALELVRVEAIVGSFWADIVARNVSEDNSVVVIENQLGQTDHTHLGQILTYLAGLEAKTIVWISKRLRDEHRAALEWLNSHTGDAFRFFGVEVELWRIRDSLPAPRFHVAVKPNDWVRAERAQVQTSESGNQNLTFWTAFTQWLAEHSPEVRVGSPNRTTNLWISVPETSFALSLFRAKNGVGLFVRSQESGAEAQEQARKVLENQLSLLNAQLDTTAAPGARFLFRRDEHCDPNETSEWDHIFQWFNEMIERYSAALTSLVRGTQ